MAERRVCTIITAAELDALVQQHLGVEWSCVAAGEWTNESEHLIPVRNTEALDAYEQAQMKRLRAGRWDAFDPTPATVMQALCLTGALAPGDYLVTVSW